MTSKEINALAEQAGISILIEQRWDRWEEIPEFLERFANLVVAAEREACAAFLETGVDMAGLAGDPVLTKYTFELLTGCAAAIRARG